MIDTVQHILSHPGRRPLNEDSVYPQHVNAGGARSYLVCDGVGGSNKGEVASSIVCRVVGSHLATPEVITENDIRRAVSLAETSLSEHSKVFPECRGMASTLVGFHPVDGHSAYVFWVGDSRLYHVRDGQILFRTKDHSLVQMMVDQGQITEEEAMQSSRRNIILQAIGDGNRYSTPEIHKLEDIREGDFILLMSDGILEGCGESEIVDSLNSDPLRTVVGKIRSSCEENSRDNFSLIALEIL